MEFNLGHIVVAVGRSQIPYVTEGRWLGNGLRRKLPVRWRGAEGEKRHDAVAKSATLAP